MALRIAFFGTPAFAVPTLTEIVGQGHTVVAVYAQPPRAAGRGLAERRSPVHEVAVRFGLPVFTPPRLKAEGEAERFADLAVDLAVVVAYGQILPTAFLEVPEHGFLNLHASLLPRWRGAAPIARAIMAGDSETGVMVMRVEEGLDTGPVALTEKVVIHPDMMAGELHDELMETGAGLVVRALLALEEGSLPLSPQSAEGVTYAKKIEKSETRVDWTRPGRQVHNHIRGLSPFPGAWCEMSIGAKAERVKLLRSTLGEGNGSPGTALDDSLTIACGDGAVRLEELQRAGGKALRAADFLRGAKIEKGMVIS
jgi:methionyl-tRNA formyltransferase